MKKYGHIISKLRKKQGLTQEQLGKKLNVSYQAISKWENNLSEPYLETIEKLTEVFGISMSDFFDMAKNPENIDNNSTIKEETNIKESKNFIKTKPWYLVAGLGVLIVILSLCAFLIPVKYSGKQIFDKYESSIFYLSAERPSSTSKGGTGFFINKTGLAVTVYSNIEECSSATIRLNNGEKYNVEKIVGIDKEKNIAIIQIDIKNSKPIKLGNSNDLLLGDKVYSITYTTECGLNNANSILSEGIVYKVESDSSGTTSVQTTATTSKANKGGVLFNENGEAIGIVSKDLNLNGINFDMVNVCIPINDIKSIERDINLSMSEYLKNQKGTYNIIFDGNGSTGGNMQSQECLRDYSYNLSTNQYERTGYEFDGWSYSLNLYKDGERIINLAFAGETIILKAKWKLIDYQISYVLNNGVNSELNPTKYNYEDEIILDVAEKTGYAFVGWYNNENFSGQKITQINLASVGDVTLYAKFEIIHYNITYVLEDGVSNINPTSYTIEDGIITLQPIEKNGYQFQGWFIDEQKQTPITEIDSAQLKEYTLYCQFLTIKEIDGYRVIETSYDLFTILNENRTDEKKLILCSDLDMQEEYWHPLPFIGHFKGNGHKISNFVINTTIDFSIGENLGLFSKVENAVIEDLIIENALVFSKVNASGVQVGILVGTAENSVIKNCCVKSSKIEAYSGPDSHNWYQSIGGMCGKMSNSTLENSFASINIEYTNRFVITEVQIGGLIGCAVYTNYTTNSFAEGSITCKTSTTNSKTFIGGVLGGDSPVGRTSTINIENCYSSVNIILEEMSANKTKIGGLLGDTEQCHGGFSIKNSFYAGNITNYNNEIYHYDWILGYELVASNITTVKSNCFSYNGCTYTKITENILTKTNTDGSSFEEINNFVAANWDVDIWNIDTTKFPRLKSFEVE